MKEEFIWRLKNNDHVKGSYVLLWMQNSFRVKNNNSLKLAIDKSNELNLPLIVFTAIDEMTMQYDRHAHFYLDGICEVESELNKLKIRYVVWNIDPLKGIQNLAEKASLIISDLGYLKESIDLIKQASELINCTFLAVESNIIIPVRLASPKEEYSAGTFRKKVKDRINHYLTNEKLKKPVKSSLELDLKSICIDDYTSLKKYHCSIQTDCSNISLNGGYSNATKILKKFIKKKLSFYDTKRSDPAIDMTSSLSPYLKFGHISPSEIALSIINSGIENVDSFLEELIIRRELSINFTYYNRNYDSIKSLPQWAQITLRNHETFPREYIYSKSEFENFNTHDEYWNSAQHELVKYGKIHNYMRMYWGKKIIEWTNSPDDAIDMMIYLNNKYALDGSDPNSYAGILWCLGKHDRAWGERPVFGKVRYMNSNGLKRKFNMKEYFDRIGFIPKSI